MKDCFQTMEEAKRKEHNQMLFKDSKELNGQAMTSLLQALRFADFSCFWYQMQPISNNIK